MFNPTNLVTAATIALGTTAGALAAGGTFTVVGPGTNCDLSYDATTIVGTDFSTGEAFIWHVGDPGPTLIGGDGAVGVSANGSVVCGNIVGDSGKNEVAVWSLGNGWTALGGPAGSGGCDANLSNGYEISGSGLITVGLGWDGCDAGAFRLYSPLGVMETLPQEGPNSTRANNISNDGLVIGGWDEAANGERRAALWFNDGSEILPLVGAPNNPSGGGEVYVLNNDGSYCAGTFNGPIETGGGFRWRASDGQVDVIPALPGTDPIFFSVIPLGITEDGSTVVGTNISGFGPFAARTAFIWDEVNGTRVLADVLTADGVSIPVGFALSSADGLSPDGTTMCGTGGSGLFPDTFWILHLGGGTCTGDVNGDGEVGFDDLLDVLSFWGPCPI